MATKLRRLRLNRCDLVDRPANPEAHVVLYKRDSSFLERELAYFAKRSQTVKVESPLITSLQKVIASSYHLYLLAHAAHWNIEGAVFPAWHDFFGSLYEDVFGAIDSFAESIRQHGAYAPSTFTELLKSAPEPVLGQYVPTLIGLNTQHMSILTEARQAADMAGDEGLANYCQERLGKHLKYDWQLRAMDKA